MRSELAIQVIIKLSVAIMIDEIYTLSKLECRYFILQKLVLRNPATICFFIPKAVTT